MPQLDLLTFFTQFFWAILCLFVFYFFVNKLILPELTRVLKYRSKASVVSTSSGDKPDGLSQQRQDGKFDHLADLSGRSGSSTLYKDAITSSARALTQARQKRDTFLKGVSSGNGVKAGFISSLSKQDLASQDALDAHSDSSSSSSTKRKRFHLTQDSKSSTRVPALPQQSSKGEKKKSKSAKNPKNSKKAK